MSCNKLLEIQTRYLSICHHPLTGDHYIVGAVCSTHHQCRQRITRSRKAQFIQLKKSQIGLFARADLT